MNKKIKKYSKTISLSLFLFFQVQAVKAQGVFEKMRKNLGGFQKEAQLPDDVLFIDAVIKIINLVLSFLALVFIILVIYGGFLYLTSGGVADKAKKGLDVIKHATIGVAIILASYIFVNFILFNVVKVLTTA